MEKALANSEWVVTDDFTLADVCLAPYFQTLEQFNWTELYEADCPRVTDWVARCRARPAYQEAVAQDFPAALTAELQQKGSAVWHKITAHLGTN